MPTEPSPFTTDAVPAALGYRMAAEWEPHAATWLAWPHKRESWPDKFEPIPPLYARFIRMLTKFEPVHVLAGGEPVMAEARSLVGEISSVTLHNIPTNDAWTRDHGPTFLVGPPGSPPALVDWGYNAWGGKYPPFDLDDAVPQRIAAATSRRRFEPGIILEGGAIDSNGSGTILTTEQCLLNPNRNPHLKKADVERFLADYLGAKKVLWLGEGIEGDDTDGHIDELARFVGPRTIVAALDENHDDPNYCPLRENFERLRHMTDEQGRPLDVFALPMPRPIFHEGQRLPVSYCNFYIANGAAFVPQFNDPADAKAIELLGRLLPARQMIGLPARDLAWGLGAYHCITQQEPAVQ